MEKVIQKTKIPNILPGKWEQHRNHRNSEYLATHGGQRLWGLLKAGSDQGIQGFPHSGLENLLSCTDFLGNLFQSLTILTVKKGFLLAVRISMLASYADLNLLFSFNYHHTVCLSRPGAFRVLLQHCLPFYTAEEQKSATIRELKGAFQSLLISQLPKK